MKRLNMIMLLFCIVFFVRAQDVTVKGNTKLNTSFKEYKTFEFAQLASANELIKSAIQGELELRGFVYTASTPADLVVSYQVLEKRTRVKGFLNDDPTRVGGEEIRQAQDTTTFTLEPGTLSVKMMDRKTSEVIWDGFASGIHKDSAFVADETKVKEVVRKIFQEFKHRATPLEN